MMRQNSNLFRLSATVALGGLLCSMLLPAAAFAQQAPSPVAQPQTPPDQNQADPPARVGRIAALTGAVSFRTASDTEWSNASANYPVASGNAFWTESTAEATLEVSASRIALAPQTELDVTTLDTNGMQAVIAQGETYLHLADLAPNEAWSVQTPRGQIRLSTAGRYDIVAGTTEQATTVTVLEGSAEIDGPGVSLQIATNETATISGSDPFQGSVSPAVRDAFLAARLNAERPPPRPPAALPAPVMSQVTAMPGGEDLTTTGSWSQAPQYGQVWYPPVSPGWVPYRQGHWAYVAPWGWTWVDDAPWGFAPFHYGRWVQVDNRWCWTPGQVEVAAEPPVYAPALVTFFGAGVAVGVGVGLGAALAGGSVGWVPLGPREPYHPWYHASDNYIRQVNISHATNVTNITNVTTVNNFINRGAATSVPASVMTASRPVQVAAQPVTAQALASARPVFGRQPIAPSPTTAGVTPAIARQLNLPPRAAAAFRPAPGPAVRVQAPVPAGAAAPRPPLIGAHGEPAGTPRPGPAAAGVAPGVPAAPQAPHERGGPPPALVAPGARPAGVPEPPGGRRGGTPPAPAAVPEAHPGAVPHPGVENRPAGLPENHPAAVERPPVVPQHPAAPPPHAAAAPPESRPSPMPHPAPPEAAHPTPTAVPHVETPRPAAPHVEAPRAPPQAPRPAPPPHVEAPRPAPPPRVEAPRPAPPARVEAPRPPPAREPPPHEKRPNQQ